LAIDSEYHQGQEPNGISMSAKGIKVGYRRVSAVDQKLDRQDLGEVDRVFEEKISGRDRNRPKLEELIRFVREGDQVIVYSIDRLARSLDDLKKIVEEINDKGASVTFKKESLTFSPGRSDPMAMFQLHLMGAFAQFEREVIRQRQIEGIEIAKAKGKYTGSRPWTDHDQIAELLETTDIKVKEIARRTGASQSTIFRILRERFGMTRAELRLRHKMKTAADD